MIQPWLIELLVCPRCQERVRLNDRRTALSCERCRMDYPVEDGVPQMLVESARPWPEGNGESRKDS